MSFERKVVLVTGSGSGIGQAIAILFAKNGADVVIVELNEESANKTAKTCKEFGKRVLAIKTDVSKTEEVKNAIDKTIKEFGKIDVLINNAAIIRKGRLLDGTIMDTYDEVLNTNLRGAVLMTSLATPYLRKTKGCIVNISSIGSMMVQKSCFYPAYTISKAGIDCFTSLSALELGPSGVRVNAVNPGPVFTNLLNNSGSGADFKDYDYSKLTVLGKAADPEEIGDLVLFLASDKAKSITGSSYVIDNGIRLK